MEETLRSQSDYLSRWHHSLGVYGISEDYVGRSGELFVGELKGADERRFKFIFIDLSNLREKRDELIRKQERYVPKLNTEDYPFSIDEDCFLCHNIMQAVDTSENGNQNSNLMYDLGDYVILPNKYPHEIGLSLFLPKSHDDMGNRVRVGDKPENGKTRAKVITIGDLETLVDFSDKHDLVVSKNHPCHKPNVQHWNYVNPSYWDKSGYNNKPHNIVVSTIYQRKN